MTASDIMSKRVISTLEDQPMILAAEIMNHYGFNGLPVITRDNTLVGLVTEYDLINKGSRLHIPTFLKIVGNLPLYKNDSSDIKEEVKNIFLMTVKEVMNSDPLTIAPDMPVEEVARQFSEHHRVNPIVVVDKEKKVLGVVSRADILSFYFGKRRSENVAADFKTTDARNIDEKMKQMFNTFEKEFVVVSKIRSKFWIVGAIILGIVGFILGIIYLGNFDIKF